MEKITVARLGPSDLKAALHNVLTFWDEPPVGADLQKFLNDPGNVLLEGQRGGELAGGLLGYVLGRPDGKPAMLFLYSIDVLSAHRRVGVARAMIREFLRTGREAGCGKAFVLTDAGNGPAMTLYAATGALRPRQNDVLYEWEL